MTIADIRHRKLSILLQEECGGNVSLMANKLGKAYPQVYQWIKRTKYKDNNNLRAISSMSARHIELIFNKPVGWMDIADTLDVPLTQNEEENVTLSKINSMGFDELISVISTLTNDLNTAKARLADVLSQQNPSASIANKANSGGGGAEALKESEIRTLN